MQARRFGCLAILAAILAGCAAPKPPPVVVPPPPPPPPPPHFGPPPALHCAVAPFAVADGGTVTVSMQVSPEGGYCAATLTAASGKPFDAPLVPVMAEHGSARVIKYNGKTSVEYTPNPGYVGADHFVVQLIVKDVPGYTTLNVGVQVGPAKD